MSNTSERRRQTVSPSAATRGPGPTASRLVLALVGAFAVAAGIIAAGFAGLMQGPLAVALVVIVWVAVPSSGWLSRRLAINGAIGLGLIPFMWWMPWPFGSLSHASVFISLGVAAVTFLALWKTSTRRALYPRTALGDLWPVLSMAFSVWFFLPFFTATGGLRTVNILINAFGNDNVAHFNMFSMIRRMSAVGQWWGQFTDGTPFAYVVYPQHFHAFAAFTGEVWAGPTVGSLEHEAGLFGVATALTLIVAIITLSSAIVSIPLFRQRPWASVIPVVATISFILLGFGSSALDFGFPNFLFAVLATLIATVLVVNRRSASLVDLIASAGLAVAVAHSWSILAPMAAVPLMFTILRLPWRRWRAYPAKTVAAVVTIAAAAAAAFYAAVLVWKGTVAAGSPEAALSTTGGLLPVSLTLVMATALVLIGVSGALGLWGFTRRGALALLKSRVFALGGPMFCVAVTGSLVASVLIVVQLRRVGVLSYFQLKTVNALYLIFAILAVVAICLLIIHLARKSPPIGAVVKAVVSITVSLSLLVFAGLPDTRYAGLEDFKMQGLIFRDSIFAESDQASEGTLRLQEAARVMASGQCDRPIYVVYDKGDLVANESNQWAMAFSGTWSASATDINSFLWQNNPIGELDSTAYVARALLEQNMTHCVVVAPEVYKELRNELGLPLADRVVTW